MLDLYISIIWEQRTTPYIYKYEYLLANEAFFFYTYMCK